METVIGLTLVAVAIYMGLCEIASSIRRQNWNVNIPPIEVNHRRYGDKSE